jgi:hypothetical protein
VVLRPRSLGRVWPVPEAAIGGRVSRAFVFGRDGFVGARLKRLPKALMNGSRFKSTMLYHVSWPWRCKGLAALLQAHLPLAARLFVLFVSCSCACALSSLLKAALALAPP